MKNNQSKREKVLKAIYAVMTCSLLLFSNVQVVHAVGLGKRAADAISVELMWGALIVTAVVVLTAFAKKAYIQAVITALVGGLIAFLISNLGKIKAIGESIGNILFP